MGFVRPQQVVFTSGEVFRSPKEEIPGIYSGSDLNFQLGLNPLLRYAPVRLGIGLVCTGPKRFQLSL